MLIDRLGANFVLFGLCVYILLFVRRNAQGLNKPMLITAIAMFVVSSAHMVVGIIQVIVAFIGDSYDVDGAIKYFAQRWLPLSIARQALYAANNIIADGLLIYRCYVVWDFNWNVIILPIIMLIGTAVCFVFSLYGLSETAPGQGVFISSIDDWGITVFSVSLATNVLVTFLIASRVYWVVYRLDVPCGEEYRHKYHQAVAIIIESGSIQSAAILILLVLHSLNETSQYIMADALAQLLGIVPTLIIVRCGLCTKLPCTKIRTNHSITTISQEFSSRYPVPMQLPKSVDETMNSNDEMAMKCV
ncbi:hypothetical protein M378DRAFT_86165 [Amanita muscaria Koide BX008]|uniref:Uncharacterized protein n=1 Tax=Amanita muscaria (strain Koide BX008) TaxID=946122 RepID=A0A0C2SX10_AMAMK|nr:hypothetical protein M378DRAFT_86165 [Amanita muscaria Koide BX008]